MLLLIGIAFSPAASAMEVDLRDDEIAPGDRTLRLTRDGVDIDGDGATDYRPTDAEIATSLHLTIYLGSGNHEIRFAQADTDLRIGMLDISFWDASAGHDPTNIDIALPRTSSVTLSTANTPSKVRIVAESVSLYTKSGDDVIDLTASSCIVKTMSGNDLVGINVVKPYGGSPDCSIDLGEGDDRIRVRGRGSVVIHGGPGRDRIVTRGSLVRSAVSPGTGDDIVLLGPGSDGVCEQGRCQGGGNDVIDTGTGNAIVWDDFGSNRIKVGAAPSKNEIDVRAQPGTKQILVGGPGADWVRLEGTGTSIVSTGAGNDKLIYNSGSVIARMGHGKDEITIRAGGTPNRRLIADCGPGTKDVAHVNRKKWIATHRIRRCEWIHSY